MRQKSGQKVAKGNESCVVPGAEREDDLQKLKMGNSDKDSEEMTRED